MDTKSLIVNFLLTALIYGIGPILFLLLRKRPLSTRTLKTFHIVYTVLTALLFAVGNSLSEERISFSPALIWGLIFYEICKSKFEDRGLLDVACIADGTQQPAETGAPREQLLVYEVQTAAPKEACRDDRRSKAALIALSVLLAVSIAGNVYQATQEQAKSQEITALQGEVKNLEGTVNTMRASRDILSNRVDTLKSENEELESYVKYFNNSIGFVVPGNKYYHCYGCPVVEEAGWFQAHNIEYCKVTGYSKHSACWGVNIKSLA